MKIKASMKTEKLPKSTIIKNETEDDKDVNYSSADVVVDSVLSEKNDPLFEYLTLNELKTDLCEIKMAKNENDVDEPPEELAFENTTTANADDTSDDDELVNKAEFVNGRYICPICSKSLADKSTLTLHLRLHTGKKLKHCSLCNRGFSKQSHLNRHMNSHNKKVYTCDYCDETFDTYQARRIHASTKHGDKKKSAASSNSVVKRKQPSSTLVSDIATKSTKLVDGMYKMWQRSKTFKCTCNICESSFEKISDLRKHLMQHADDEQCFANIVALPKRSDFFEKVAFDLRIQADDVTGEMLQLLFKSTIQNNLPLSSFYKISNEFGWEFSLSDSESETETTDHETAIQNQYNCTKCNESFDRLHKIISHVKNYHYETIATDFADFQCTHCKCYFPNSHILNKHLRSQCENSNKKFSCKICGCRFMWRNSLDMHTKRMHEGVESNKTIQTSRTKSFTCDICARIFHRQEHLERHKKIHSPAERRFCCDICDKKFNRKDNLK